MRRVGVLVFALLALAGALHAQDADTSYLDARVDATWRDASLGAIASDLAARAGVRVKVEPAALAARKKLSLVLRGARWRDALDRVAFDAGLVLRGVPGGVQLMERPDPPRVTIVGEEERLRHVIVEIARAGSMSLVLAPEVRGRVSVAVHDEPCPRALRALLKPRGLHAVVRGSVLLVSSLGPGEGESELGDDEPAKRIHWPARKIADEQAVSIHAPVGLDDLVRFFERRGREPIFADVGLVATFTTTFDELPWREALDVMTAAEGLEVHAGSGALLIRRPRVVTCSREGDAAATLDAIAAAVTESLVVSETRGRVLVDLRGACVRDAISAIGSACRVRVARVGERPGVVVVSPHAVGEWREPETLVDGLLGAARDQKIDVSVEEADLREVMDEIGRRVGRTIVTEPIDERVTFSTRRVGWRRAADLIARVAGARIDPFGAGALLVHREPCVKFANSGASVRTLLELAFVYAGRNGIVAADLAGRASVAFHDVDELDAVRAIALARGASITSVVPGVPLVSPEARGPELVVAPPAPDPSWRRADDRRVLIDMSVEDADLADVVAEIASRGGVRVALGPGVQPKLTSSARHIDWRDLLDVLAKLTACRLRRAETGIRLEAPPRTLFQASDVSAATWIALVRRLGATTCAPFDADAGLTFDLHELTPDEALRVTQEALPRKRPHGALPRKRRRPGEEVELMKELAPDEDGELEAEVSRVFEWFDAQPSMESVSWDELGKRIDPLLARAGGRAAFEEHLERWAPGNRRRDALIDMLRTRLMLQDASELLVSLGRARQREDFDGMDDLAADVEAMVGRMRRSGLTEAPKDFRAHYARALEEARPLRAFRARFPIRVRAIALVPGATPTRLVVIARDDEDREGRIYAEGDRIEAGAAVATIARIEEARVFVRFEGADYACNLAVPRD